MTSETEPNRLTELLQWLDTHINYERSGPPDRRADNLRPARRLELMAHMLELMDDPHRTYPSVHITGTNGKTSTSRMITQLFLAQGLRAGTYTSPHLEQINERIAVNNEPIGDGDLVDVLQAVRLLEGVLAADECPTYFEIVTAAGMRHFADAPVDVGVFEVGVGGRWDATNVIDGQVAVITNIGSDHLNYLGSTKRDIAEQKAGIVKATSTLVTAERDPELVEVLSKPATGKALVLDHDFQVVSNRMAVGGRLIDVRTPHATYTDVFVATRGSHQGVNAATALVATEAFFGRALHEDVVRDAFGSITTPGRFEIVSREPLCILDGAHNPEAARQLTTSLDEELSARPDRILVVGMLDPHEPAELLPALGASRARMVIATTAPSPRAVSAEAIADAARELGPPVVVVEDVAAAVDEARRAAGEETVVVISGSLYVVGAARTALEAQA